MCINLSFGGGNVKLLPEEMEKARRKGAIEMNKILLEKLKNDPQYKKKFSAAVSKGLTGKPGSWIGKNHSIETKEKMRKSALGKHEGSKNSQFGTYWIHNSKEVKKIQKEELNVWIERGWSRGRK